ncbi:MAG: HAD family hydrolase [Candidatus Tectomicrobia bacterium]|uniref:phosphoglycolate phosphatase n=1 Tax=Tectimicrobiota bacterium TaxID=2528274 RepID=A0A932FW01_UNCTE|nr:HAD family hydrolase [Candidatus Tectomicrobia bacterium]
MQLVIFDIDGTLTQTTRIDELCFLRALAEEFGITAINTNWLDYAYSTDSGIALQILQEQWVRCPSSDELLRFQHRFVHLLMESCAQSPDAFIEVPGATAAFRRLREETNWTVAIATGGWRASALFKLSRIGIDAQQVPAAFADDSPLREEIVQTALSRAASLNGNEPFQRVVYVGDAVWDVRTAQQLGLAFLGVQAEAQSIVLRNEGAAEVLEDFTHFDRFLRALEEASVPARGH